MAEPAGTVADIQFARDRPAHNLRPANSAGGDHGDMGHRYDNQCLHDRASVVKRRNPIVECRSARFFCFFAVDPQKGRVWRFPEKRLRRESMGKPEAPPPLMSLLTPF